MMLHLSGLKRKAMWSIPTPEIVGARILVFSKPSCITLRCKILLVLFISTGTVIDDVSSFGTEALLCNEDSHLVEITFRLI